MIPSGNSILTTDLEVKSQPSKQHKMMLDNNRIVDTCDALEGVRQTVYKILNTERYQHLIYSWNYGIELMSLYGKPPMVVCPEIEDRVREALIQDERITSVDTFTFDTSKKGVVAVAFTVHTIYGDLTEELVVNY